MMEQKKNIIGGDEGFTLVETLAVLVILAIMAAISIPTMKGFIDDAKVKSHLTQARSAYVACQAAASELAAGSGEPTEQQVIAIAEKLMGDELGNDKFTVELSGFKVVKITYVPEGSKEITISADGNVTYEK